MSVLRTLGPASPRAGVLSGPKTADEPSAATQARFRIAGARFPSRTRRGRIPILRRVRGMIPVGVGRETLACASGSVSYVGHGDPTLRGDGRYGGRPVRGMAGTGDGRYGARPLHLTGGETGCTEDVGHGDPTLR